MVTAVAEKRGYHFEVRRRFFVDTLEGPPSPRMPWRLLCAIAAFMTVMACADSPVTASAVLSYMGLLIILTPLAMLGVYLWRRVRAQQLAEVEAAGGDDVGV